MRDALDFLNQEISHHFTYLPFGEGFHKRFRRNNGWIVSLLSCVSIAISPSVCGLLV